MRPLLVALLLVAACGSVTQDPPPGAAAGAGGELAGGAAGAAGAVGGAGGTVAGGMAGTAGADSPGPCAGLCDAPKKIGVPFNSGNLGLDASCYQTTSVVTAFDCGNFSSPRTLTVNGQLADCSGDTLYPPAPSNGGFCFVVSAGGYSFAYFEDR